MNDPSPCPDPLCIYDLDPLSPQCQKCQQGKSLKPHSPSWGGNRPGAGAPQGNLNHLVHGRDSTLIKRAVKILAENPDLRPFLLLIARAAVQGEIPQTTKQLILQAMDTPQHLAASSQLRRLRNES